MESKRPSPVIGAAFCLVVAGIHLTKASAFNPPYYPKVISDLKEATINGLGLEPDDFKISGFDLRDALVGRSVAYEFELEIDNNVLPLNLLEDVNKWETIDLPVSQMENPVNPEEENRLLEKTKVDDQMPVLAPFQLAGPMELWIQDAKDMRISLPHDVDAGVLKKVTLADGVIVTVNGARSVGLHHPVELPLPLNATHNNFASGLKSLAEHLQYFAHNQGGPLLSLCIVGPTSLTAPASSSPSSSNRLKLKHLAPGLVELSSASKTTTMENDLQGEATALLAADESRTMWPFVSINASNSNLLGFEVLLSSLLGRKANEEGSFKVLKADVSAQTFVKVGFGVEQQLKEVDIQGFQEWRTKPLSLRLHFEVMGKVDENGIVPERVVQVEPVAAEDSVATSMLLGNITTSKMPTHYQPPNPFML